MILPDLQYLQYKTMQLLQYDEQFQSNAFRRYLMNPIHPQAIISNLTCEVFPQAWDSPIAPFEEVKDSTYFNSQITYLYTVVFHENLTDTYIVYFDNKPCYIINNPTDNFLLDLKNRQLKPLYAANQLY